MRGGCKHLGGVCGEFQMFDFRDLVYFSVFIIIPKIFLLDFSASNLRFGHISVCKIV